MKAVPEEEQAEEEDGEFNPCLEDTHPNGEAESSGGEVSWFTSSTSSTSLGGRRQGERNSDEGLKLFLG